MFKIFVTLLTGPGSSVCIATGYGLDGPGIEFRWGEVYCTCTMGTGCFPRVESSQGVTLTPHPSSAEV
jgi:hypothetical protein